jgi:hypothetical protein
MPSEVDIEVIREVLSRVPDQFMEPGRPIEWGPYGNKERAILQARFAGHEYDVNCKDCDFDLWTVLRSLIR